MALSEKQIETGPPGLVDKEAGLARQLSQRQLAMIAIGGAIGTGLFLGSSLAVQAAGPSVIITYVLGAIVAVLLMGALSEMAAVHPTAGSFGVYAEICRHGPASSLDTLIGRPSVSPSALKPLL